MFSTHEATLMAPEAKAKKQVGTEQQQQQRQQQPDVVKPEVTGLASGASRRALGDITNARGAKQPGGVTGKLTKTTTRAAAAAALGAAAAAGVNTSFGLASAAPPVLYQQPAPAISAARGAGEGTMSGSNAVTRSSMKLEAGVEDMDLIQEVDEIDMHIEESEPDQQQPPQHQHRQPLAAKQQQGQEELGSITKDLQGMTIKHPALLRPAPGPDVDDIDKADASNPMACVEYLEEQYRHYREKECRPGYDPSYMGKQPYINLRMRAILVDWLVEVHYKFKCCPETLYLTVNLIDRFLDRKQVPRPKLQLVGVTAFLIACKYEEIYPPEVKELVYMTDGAYTRKQIIDMESFMLATLKFQVTVCTTHCFLVRFLKAGHADNKIYFLASYICERTLQEVDILHFLPSMVAAAAVYLARKNCGLRPWSPTLIHYTKYTEESLLSCLRVITPWLNTRSQSLQAIRKKYGSVKYMMVSSLDLEGV